MNVLMHIQNGETLKKWRKMPALEELDVILNQLHGHFRWLEWIGISPTAFTKLLISKIISMKHKYPMRQGCKLFQKYSPIDCSRIIIRMSTHTMKKLKLLRFSSYFVIKLNICADYWLCESSANFPAEYVCFGMSIS